MLQNLVSSLPLDHQNISLDGNDDIEQDSFVMNQEKIKDEPETPKVLDISDGDDDNEQDSFA